MNADDDEARRQQIDAWLKAGLQTQTEPFPQDELEFAGLLRELRGIDDLKARLICAGMKNSPHGENQDCCKTCMYYMVHRRWCALPELAIPVEADWWCRLWRT